MKNKTRGAIIIILITSFSPASFGQLPFIEDIDILPQNYDSNLKEINTIVSSNYCHLKNKKINIDSLYSSFHDKVIEVESKDDYFKLLMNYFSELRNSHTIIFLREYGLKASVKLIENQLYLKNVDDSVLVEAGVSRNDRILEIDGIRSIDWLNMQRNFISASTPQHELNNTLWKVFNSEFKISRSYKFETKEGIKTVQTKIERPTKYGYTYPRDLPKCVGKKLDESTGYISISSMTGNVTSEFETAYASLSKMSNLIIDLRENHGGNSGFSELITQYLIHSKQKACVSGRELKPKTNKYEGKLIVLVGIKTASAAESFAIDLLESGNTVLIGSPTAGDTGNNPSNFTTDYGVSFRIPTRNPPQVSNKNFPMEGVGIPPHFVVKQTVEDFNYGIDTVLEYTLNFIDETIK